jgi:hypothetical protein
MRGQMTDAQHQTFSATNRYSHLVSLNHLGIIRYFMARANQLALMKNQDPVCSLHDGFHYVFNPQNGDSNSL